MKYIEICDNWCSQIFQVDPHDGAMPQVLFVIRLSSLHMLFDYLRQGSNLRVPENCQRHETQRLLPFL